MSRRRAPDYAEATDTFPALALATGSATSSFDELQLKALLEIRETLRANPVLLVFRGVRIGDQLPRRGVLFILRQVVDDLSRAKHAMLMIPNRRLPSNLETLKAHSLSLEVMLLPRKTPICAGSAHSFAERSRSAAPGTRLGRRKRNFSRRSLWWLVGPYFSSDGRISSA